MPKVSCIVVNFNNERFLERAVRSLLQQTRVPDEIIIADDASTDHSANIIRQFENADHRIKGVFRSRNIGVAANRDLAIRDSSGTYFTTLDSDDWFYPEKIEKELHALGNSDNAIACSDIDLVQNDRVFDTIRTEGFCRLTSSGEQLRFLVSRKKGMPRDMLMARSLYVEAGGMRHELKRYEDWDFKQRLADMGLAWKHSGITGMAYRREGAGLSSANQFRHSIDKVRVIGPRMIHSRERAAYLLGLADLIFLKGSRKILRRKRFENEVI